MGAAEPCVAIIAASIPTLRVLIKEVISSRGYYLSNDSAAAATRQHGTNLGRLHDTSTVIVAERTPTSRKLSEKDSNERILDRPNCLPVPDSGIMQTNEVNIRYGPRMTSMKDSHDSEV